MRRSTIQSIQNPSLCIRETPLRLVARVGVSLWCNDRDIVGFRVAESVCDVCAGVLVAW
jgi:hypothetical protein